MNFPSDLRILHFRIPDHSLQPRTAKDHPQPGTLAKTGTHHWTCQLTLLADKATLLAFLGPLATTDINRADFQACCALQVTASALTDLDSSPDTDHVLLSKRIKPEDLFKRGIEFYIDREDVWVENHYEFYIILSSHPIKLLGPANGTYWTHTLALSESDPVARNIDPLVEMMTQFEHRTQTSDVECRFISKAGLVLDRIRAHHAVLSIYPAFSQKMALAQQNPHQRATTTVLIAPIGTLASFERLLGFIYSGRLPREGFVPRSDQWRMAFELAREYGLEKCPSSSPWMAWHLSELHQVLTDENVLEIYFGWGHEHAAVAQMCVRHVAERSQVQFQGQNLGSHVISQLKEQYQSQCGCFEFQEALVVQSMKIYAEQLQARAMRSSQNQWAATRR